MNEVTEVKVCQGNPGHHGSRAAYQASLEAVRRLLPGWRELRYRSGLGGPAHPWQGSRWTRFLPPREEPSGAMLEVTLCS